jgi:hypothetical protein
MDTVGGKGRKSNNGSAMMRAKSLTRYQNATGMASVFPADPIGEH